MLRRNSLKQKLSEKKLVVGIFLEIPEPAHAEIAGLAEMDFVIIDWEHGSLSRESAMHMVRATASTGISPVVRVRENSPLAIQEALDVGAVAVQIPHVSEKEAALSACQAARFYPRGHRGLNPYIRSASYYAQTAAEYLKDANEDVVVIGQIEGADGVRNLSEILTVPGLDVIFLGPYDLSQSLGIPGQLDHPRLIEAMKQVIEVAGRTGIVVGTFADSPDRALSWIKLGVRYVAVSTDSEIFLSASRRLVEKIRSEL
jgi:4-hydroxy-2-oxoheptanedioate aldolase